MALAAFATFMAFSGRTVFDIMVCRPARNDLMVAVMALTFSVRMAVGV